MEQTQTAARNGLPWALIMVVALLIAKFGFGVQIAWLWVLAPIWIPFAIGLVIVLGIIAFGLIALLVALVFDLMTRNRRRYVR